ncbi:MAG: tetratricopeptide repeat protein [Chloroflexi bacterium]|nr:tetratricopeptide repeat protein [Chloroflexota bacterium]
MPPLTLKGKDRPVVAWRLIGGSAGPAAAQRRGPSAGEAIVGRVEERAALAASVRELSAGTGGVLALIGEAGVGKSRLTEDMRVVADGAGVVWLEARCLSYGAGLPYWPYADLVRRTAGIGPDDTEQVAGDRLAEALTKFGADDSLPFLSRLVGLPAPAGSDEVDGLEPEAFRRRLHGAFASWVRGQLARTAGVVLALEDAHWADPSTLDLTAELARLCSTDPLLLFVTARPEARGRLTTVAVAAGRPDLHEVTLGALATRDIESLLGHVLGSAPSAELATIIAERSAGNPFLAEALARSLQERGWLIDQRGRWHLSAEWDADAVPPTIEGVLGARIDVLPTRAAQVLQVAAVIGRRVRVQLLERIAGAPAELGATLDQLVVGAFIELSGEAGGELLTFRHSLVQDVAYARLLRRHRRDLHRRVAQAAETLYGSGDDVIDLLARHLYLGEAGMPAIAYLLRAAERARRLFANEEAIVHLRHAADIVRAHPEGAPQLPLILMQLADLHELRGAYDEAGILYDEVRQATNDVLAWRGGASVLRHKGRYEDALALLDDAFRTTHAPSADLRALWLERGWNLSSAGRLAEAIESLTVGIGIHPPRDDGLQGHMLLELSRLEALNGLPDSALSHALNARTSFQATADLHGSAKAERVLGGVYDDLGRRDEAVAALQRGLGLAERVGSVEEIGGCLINLGVTELERGNLDEAVAYNRRAIEEFERVGHATGRTLGYANLAETLLARGDHDEALEYIERALEFARATGYRLTVADATKLKALAHEQRKDHEAAEAAAEAAATLYRELGMHDDAADSFTLAGRAAADRGDAVRAAAYRSRAESVAAAVEELTPEELTPSSAPEAVR